MREARAALKIEVVIIIVGGASPVKRTLVLFS
jgi:hypothetical protein